MKTAVYLRVSSEEQRERQTILTQQEFLCRRTFARAAGPVNVMAPHPAWRARRARDSSGTSKPAC
jgi:hypothetical protein